jgi:flagellar motor switch protein FliG
MSTHGQTHVHPSGLESAAILLMSLGEEEAAEVFKHLAPREVQRLGETISQMRSVSKTRVDEVLAAFESSASDESPLAADGSAYMKTVLRKALGEETAQLALNGMVRADADTGIDRLRWMDPFSVAQLLHQEHPQIVAAMLAHLDSAQAADVMRHLDERLRHDVLVRLATLDSIQPAALRDLNEAISHVLASGERSSATRLGGVRVAADVLNLLGRGADAAALNHLRDTDGDLAQQVMDAMFTFDDLERLDDKSIQMLLREVQTDALVVALKGATPALRDKVLRNMSSRAAQALVEEMDNRGPVRVSDVQAEQRELLKTVRRLTEEGLIAVAGGGDAQYI